MKHSVESDRLASFHPERNDVLDLEVDRVANSNAVAQAVIYYLDRRSLCAEHFAHQRRKTSHWSTQLAAEDLNKFVELVIGCGLIYVHPETPVAFCHDLRGVGDGSDFQPGDVGSFYLTLSDVENKRHSTEVISGTVIE